MKSVYLKNMIILKPMLDIQPILNIRLIYNICLTFDIYLILDVISSVFYLYVKSYIFFSYKTWTIYEPTFSLISNTREIVPKEE